MTSQKILVSGSTGLVGEALIRQLMSDGHAVSRLVRTETGMSPNDVFWDPTRRRLDTSRLERFDAVIHLAGESIADGRWSAAKKARIRLSRTESTGFLADVLSRLSNPPSVLISASAIGYYGDRGVDVMTEESFPGQSFLSDVCKDWEIATLPAAKKGIRVVNLRIGVILAQGGGALAKMLPPFKMGVGGKVGTGLQYMSWVTLDDVIGIIRHAIENTSLKGPINTVAPTAITNEGFTKALGRALKRPTLFPMPAFAAKIVFGEMAEALLLASTRVEPAALKKSGYVFKHPDIDTALNALLN